MQMTPFIPVVHPAWLECGRYRSRFCKNPRQRGDPCRDNSKRKSRSSDLRINADDTFLFLSCILRGLSAVATAPGSVRTRASAETHVAIIVSARGRSSDLRINADDTLLFLSCILRGLSAVATAPGSVRTRASAETHVAIIVSARGRSSDLRINADDTFYSCRASCV